MVELLTALPIVASAVLTACAMSLTSTVSVVAWTESAKFIVAGWLTRSSATLACFPNPAFVAVIVYLPGGIWGNSYAPLWSVLWLTWNPVVGFSMLTSAPAISAPEGSVTVLRNEVSPVCDQPRTVHANSDNTTASDLR